MSDIAKGVRTYLQTKSGVTDLISTRMYPDVLPQNATMPATTISVVSGNSEYNLTGGEGNARARVQIDCFGATRSAVNELAEAIRVELHGYNGAAGSETVQSCLMENKRDLIDQPIDGDSYAVRYRKMIDFSVIHTEAT